MKILTIIVTYNAMKWADKCFESLQNSTVKPDVYVVDNGSTDGTQEYIQKNYPNVFFCQSKNNLGFGKANNKGLQYALDNNYDYVYLLNQDAWVLPETFEKLISYSMKYPKYGILSPFQMNSDLYNIDAKFVINVCSWHSNRTLFTDMYNQRISDVYSVPEVMAAHWLITRSCLRKIGGFSPSFSHYGEDGNYCDRLLFHGIEIGIVPSLKVVHDRGNREESKGRFVFFDCYIRFLRLFSDPNQQGFHIGLIVFLFRHNVSKCLTYRTLQPLKYVFLILIHIKSVIKNRELSLRNDCAFL